MPGPLTLDITKDDLSSLQRGGPAFVAFGEVLVRETPADQERPERTRLVHLSMAGSEFTLATALSRLGIPSAYITRIPTNPYGYAVRNTAREQGIDTDSMVWAPKTEPIGRLIYEIGRTPRRNTGIYQRMYSAASRLGAGMVDWKQVLKDGRLFHTSGITFGLASHSGYKRNYNLEGLKEALENKPSKCLFGMDLNYRETLWNPKEACKVLTPIVTDHVDILITTIEDMAKLYGMSLGRYSVKQIIDGDLGPIDTDDLCLFAAQVRDRFHARIVAITIRYPDTFEQHRWESAAIDSQDHFFRSPAIRPITLWDRLGGGDTWNAGFYYGLLTSGLNREGMEKGILIGDAGTRLKQTLMFDLPIVDKEELQGLLRADLLGGGKRTSR